MGLSSLLKKLLFVNQFQMDGGKINILGDTQIMLNSSVILALQDIDDSKLYNIAKLSGEKNMAGAVEHAKVYDKVRGILIKEIADLGKKIGNSDEGSLKTLQEIFNIYGLGKMVILNIDSKNNQADIAIEDSTLAQEWMSQNKVRTKGKVCTLTAGVLAGIFSYIFGKDVNCIEKECLAEGGRRCTFKIG